MKTTDKPNRIGNIYGEDRGSGFAGNVWDTGSLAPTITTCQGGGREPMILLEYENGQDDMRQQQGGRETAEP